MANLIKWNDLDKHMGETIYEEWRAMNNCVTCRPVEYLDICHMKMEYTDCGRTYVATMGYTPDVRYWDAPPTEEDKIRSYWG